jgi:hypothetical protein
MKLPYGVVQVVLARICYLYPTLAVEEHAIRFRMPSVFFYSKIPQSSRIHQRIYTRIPTARTSLPKQAFIVGNIRVAQTPHMACTVSIYITTVSLG